MQKLKLAPIFFTTSIGLTGLVNAKPIDAMIKLRSNVSMQSLAEKVTDPRSPRYRKFYSPSEIKALAAPSTTDYRNLLKKLRSEGFKIAHESKTHLWVTVQAEPEVFASVFGAKVSVARSFTTGEETRALVTSPTVPNRFDQIESVTGLDTTRKSKHHYVLGAQARDSAIPGLSPTQIKTAYGFNPLYSAGINGRGQDIAVATYDGFKLSDVNSYFSLLKINPAPAVDQVAFNGVAKYDYNSATETELDAEFSGMIAPGAKVHVFASAANSDLGELQLFTAILDDNRAKVVNYSWGDCEAHVAPAHQAEMETVFNRAVAQGVNLLAASGDTGSDGCRDKTLNADWPAAHPSIVAVGGTTLTLNGQSKSEAGWSGSGGGISTLFDSPFWQKLPAPYSKRSFPDVAFNADPNSGQAVYASMFGIFPAWQSIGGTSMASPQWAGFLALVGQARQDAGKAPLGFLNPVIYQMTSDAKAKAFTDVTSGANGAYSAGSGWDAVTGLGSMNANDLLNYLVAE